MLIRRIQMKESKTLSGLMALVTALLVVSGSVAVPLLFRPFYYAHIDLLKLEMYANPEQIRLAYDQMMDFCLGLRPDFAVGGLAFSQEGMEHFVDVRKLFLLDLGVLGASAAVLAALMIFCKMKRVRPALLKGHTAGFWGAAGLGMAFALVGALAAVDFNKAFVVFHAVFFPGKTNWMFDWQTDPIILLLPEEFFRNCAILIFALVVTWCTALIVADVAAGKKRKALEEKRRRIAEIQAAFGQIDLPCSGCAGFKPDGKGGCTGCNAE